MKKSPYIPFAFLCLLSATSCIEEKLDPCPPQGGSVTVALRVEKFQARPPYRPSDFEQEFGKRIHSLDYLLYAGGQLHVLHHRIRRQRLEQVPQVRLALRLALRWPWVVCCPPGELEEWLREAVRQTDGIPQ